MSYFKCSLILIQMSNKKTLHGKAPRLMSVKKKHTNEDYDKLPTPPDGGYGWVIVLASFISNAVVDGICYTVGMLIFDIVNYYGESTAKTAWVGSLLSATYLCVGPLASVLCNTFGCRPVCIAGSLISTAAFVASIFSPNVNWLIFIYGFIGGMGFGFIYLPSIVCVGYYFESKRSFATAIAVCGSGAGSFVFGPLFKILSDNYGWKGANLIFAGIVFHCAICGVLLRPLKPPNSPKAKGQSRKLSSNDVVQNFKEDFRERIDSGTYLTKDKGREVEVEIMSSLSNKIDPGHVTQPISKKSIQNKSCEKISENPCCKCLPGNICNAVGQIIDISLLKNPRFMLVIISNLFGNASLYIPFVYIVACAQAHGIDSDKSTYLLSIIGISNIAGRIVCGYLTDLPQINPLTVNNICLVIAAVSLSSIPFCTTYSAYAISSVFIGIAVSGYNCLMSIIVVDIFGLGKLSSGFGLLILFRGGATLFGSPLAGALYDATHSYDPPFYVAGALFGLATIISIIADNLKKSSNEDNEILNQDLKSFSEEKKKKFGSKETVM